MLRCPPSRITLTSSDIADFEQRFAARHRKGKTAKVRLSPGPAHPTRLAFVPAERNIGRIRAASSSSEATIHNNIPTPEKEEKIVRIHEAPTATTANDTSSSGDETDGAFDKLLQRPALSTATPRRQVDSFYGTEQELDLRMAKDEPAHTWSSVDGTAEREPRPSPASEPFLPWTSRGREVLGQINSDAYPTNRHPRIAPPLLTSARARRRQTRSQDIYIPIEPKVLQEATIQASRNPIQPYVDQAFVAALDVPELVLPYNDSMVSGGVALNPDAPVFLPRTRFGTVTRSSQDALATQVGVSSHYSDLRVRSSSKQNADQNQRSQYHQPTFDSDNVVSTNLPAFRVVDATQSRMRTADQDSEILQTTHVLDRYPLMRPISRGDRSNGGASYPSMQALWSNGSANPHRTNAAGHLDEVHLQVTHASGEYNKTRQRDRIRSVSPALSTGSRSTPNLLQYSNTTLHFGARGSSLSWNRAESWSSSFARVASIPSAGNGMSGAQQMSRQSSREALDAAAAFLRMRNSPLDDLTEQFSRMSASRPRSVGRSWERPPTRPRLSLLTGDPFRPSPTPNAPSSTPVASIGAPKGEHEVVENADDVETTAADVVALSLALPPSSPLRSGSVALPSTPSLHFSQQQSPPSLAAQSPESSNKRKPVPPATTTPKIPVYDDRKPPNTQPQTPAAVRGSKRRAKSRPDTSASQLPIFVGQTTMNFPPPIPERHPHRNTYPSTAPALSDVHAVTTAPARVSRTPAVNTSESDRRHRNQGRFRAQRSSQQAENDSVEGHLQGLEEDRRIWVGRHEDGSLDVTPPREGRFERYLS